jgi:hypothetical protein
MNTQIRNTFGTNVPPIIAFGQLSETPKSQELDSAVYDPVSQKNRILLWFFKKG